MEKWPISEQFLVKVETLKKIQFHKVKLLKFQRFNFDLKLLWNWSFFHYEKIMRFKKSPQLPGAGRTRAGHHHGSHTPTSPKAVLLGKMAYHTKQIRRQCIVIKLLAQAEFWFIFDCIFNALFLGPKKNPV